MFLDRFSCLRGEGIVILHGYGNVLERRLKPRESILVEPGAFLYKDVTVSMQITPLPLTIGLLGGVGMVLVRMTGPGRVGIQSMYVHHKRE